MQLDENQIKLYNIIKNTYKKFTDDGGFFTALFNPATKKRGIYVHGPVGTGKTTIMTTFYNDLEDDKILMHYQELMKHYHKNEIFNNSIFEGKKFVCIDEIEVKDPANIVISYKILKFLLDRDAFVVCTSNIDVFNLRLDSTTQDVAKPLIDLVKKYYITYDLNTEKDYRQEYKSQTQQRVFYPYNFENATKFQANVKEITQDKKFDKFSFKEFGRDISLNKTADRILMSNFHEMFEQDFSYADYINICKYFDVIIIDKIRILSNDEHNYFIRILNLIDNIYFNRIVFISLFEDVIENIYKGMFNNFEFERIKSRLVEIDSQEYLEKSKHFLKIK